MGEKQESMAETYQKWQKTDKNDRKTFKMWSITNYLLPSFPFLSCQATILSCKAPISVLPSSLFCPARLSNFPSPPPNTPMAEPHFLQIKLQMDRLVLPTCCSSSDSNTPTHNQSKSGHIENTIFCSGDIIYRVQTGNYLYLTLNKFKPRWIHE